VNDWRAVKAEDVGLFAHFNAFEPPPMTRTSENDDDTPADGNDIVERFAYSFLLGEAFILRRPVTLVTRADARRSSAGYVLSDVTVVASQSIYR
jgi:hypothetical protein